MAKFELDFKSKKAQKFFSDLSKKGKDIDALRREYVKTIQAFVLRDVNDHFEKESGPSARWQDWSESYIQAIRGNVHFRKIRGTTVALKGQDPNGRPRKGDMSGKILQDTGRLKNNFKATNWRKKSGGIEWFNNAQTKSGFPYAYAHNEGGSKLPERRFMWLSDKALNNISEATLEFMVGKK